MPMLCGKTMSVMPPARRVTRQKSERAADLNSELSQSACSRVMKLQTRCFVSSSGSSNGGGSNGGGSDV